MTIRPGTLAGSTRIPSSKSHTIRALLIATLAEGRSRLRAPLDSLDTAACVRACRALGAKVEESRDDGHLTELIVDGTGGRLTVPDDVIDVGNSGTTLYLGMGVAALAGGLTVFTGDDQIRRRSAAPLLSALAELGATAESTRANGCAPVVVGGGLRPGPVSIESPTSQYLSSLLLAVPAAVAAHPAPGPAAGAAAPAGPPEEPEATEIEVLLLNEHPYVEMTLWWLDAQGVRYERSGFDRFRLPAAQTYHAFDTDIPADFSSATFLACAAAVTGSTLTLEGLDMNDPQGDKAVFGILEEMGCRVEAGPGAVVVAGPAGHPQPQLGGGRFDLNAIPDALPALAATACFAREPVDLVNVSQARAKETDRIAVMAGELAKMGARVEELPDGLRIRPAADERDGSRAGHLSEAPARAPLTGTTVAGHGDHRVVMALAVAGLGAAGKTSIDSAEAAAVTYPGFFDVLRSLGASVETTAEAEH
jgi:3-phosphoshikimate 1-carboxyvinyltransferase